MSNIKLVEDITKAFISGNTFEVVNILKKESRESKQKRKLVVGKRLDNLIKQIPYNNFSAAGVSSRLEEKDVYRSKIFINNPNLITEYYSGIIPEQVILNTDVKNIVSTFFRERENAESLLKFGLHPTNRILLYGPPGTGKTLLTHAIANQLDFPIVLVRLDELISSFLGRTGQNIREIFDIAKQKNVILFLDEIDTIAKHRADEKELGELKRIVTVLLQNIDLFSYNSIIIGATNHEDILDKAIWRRFPLKIKLELPNVKSRELLFSLFLEKIKKSIDMNLLVHITDGFSGSEIFDLTQQSIKNYIISKKDQLTTTDVLVAYFQLILGRRLCKRNNKEDLYKICQKLKDASFTLKDIEGITNVPYTTLRDNIK